MFSSRWDGVWQKTLSIPIKQDWIVFIESIKPSNQLLRRSGWQTSFRGGDQHVGHISILSKPFRVFEWLHFHSTPASCSIFGTFLSFSGDANVAWTCVVFVLFFITTKLSAKLRVTSITGGHDGLARCFNSSSFDYFSEDFSLSLITWCSPINAFSQSCRRRHDESAGPPTCLRSPRFDGALLESYTLEIFSNRFHSPLHQQLQFIKGDKWICLALWQRAKRSNP